MEFTVDDHTVYVYTGTREWQPHQPSVVFVHGAAMDHSVWILQSRYFAYHRYNVLAVDLPGHGRSGGEPLASIQAIAGWLLRLLHTAGIEQAALIGHSMGSLAVLEAAARAPQQCTALALTGMSCPMPVAGPLLDAALNDLPGAIDMITLWAHSPSSHLGGNTIPGLWLAGSAKRLLEKARPGVLYNDLNACNEYREGIRSAASIACPVLFVLGQHDMMTPPRAARELIAALSDSRVQILKNCGHMLPCERPDETLDELIRFLPAV